MRSVDPTSDLPLFNWTPSCRVIAFPARRRIGKVRHVAEILCGKRGRDADSYWRRTVETMHVQMLRAGISKAEADSEVRAFFDAVQAEMVRLTYRGRRPGGDAA